MRIVTACALAALAAGAHAVKAADERASTRVLVAEVLRVLDGDSLEVRLDSGIVRVRLSGVDTPEYDQPHGAAASAAVKIRVPVGTKIELEVITQDSFKRLVAIVWIPGDGARLNLNEWLLREGHAWAYRRYLTTAAYCDYEDAARASKRGLWSAPQEQWVYPPEWRFLKNGEIRALPTPVAETRESCLEVMKRAGAATYTPPN